MRRAIQLCVALAIALAPSSVARPDAIDPERVFEEHSDRDKNGFALGVAQIATYLGAPVDYDTVMGDSGLAFIVQANSLGPLIDGALDVGWWPLDHFGTGLYVEFLGDSLGREMTYTTGEWRSAEVYYREALAPVLAESLLAGRPALCHSQYQFVTVGTDDGDPPLLGGWAVEHGKDLIRIDGYPWGLYAFGATKERLPRAVADAGALRHAVELHGERSPCGEGMLTGGEALTLWAATLRDVERIGQSRWHANMIRHLKIQRRSAVAYLEAMAERHHDDVSTHLVAAAEHYQTVIDHAKTIEIDELASVPPPWEEAARIVEAVGAVEGEAIAEMSAALVLLEGDPAP